MDAGRGTGTYGRGYDESGDKPFVGERERERERDLDRVLERERSQTEQLYGDPGLTLK
jgi:hypothetical protein